VTEPDDDRPEPPAPDRGPNDGPPPLLSRLVRSVFAPDVLEDGGRDAPLSPRGRIVFWSIVSILVVGIVILLLVTASRH
jgi:hypothetical protein